MENGKTSAGRRVLNTILLLINIALIGWIVISWRTQTKPQITPDTVQPVDGSVVGNVSEISDFDASDSGSTDLGSTDSGTDNWILGSDTGSDIGAQASGSSDSFNSYATTERPTEGELDNWKQTIGYIPTDARWLTFDEAAGSWKGFIQYDMAEEMVNACLSGTASALTFTVDWYKIHYFGDGSWEDEEDMEDTALTGSWSDGNIYVTGAGSISFYAIYESDGVQYAYGEWTLPDGSSALIGLIRP